MKCLLVLAVAVVVAGATEENLGTFPEVARDARGSSRIVSGWLAEEGQFPHQLSLRMIPHSGPVLGCGASIVSANWAITAAHCTATHPSLVIRAGATRLTRPVYIFETMYYWNHPQYNEAIAHVVQPNDIGVIRFPFALEFNEFVQPIRVQSTADRNKNYDGERLTASGWGATWTGGSSPEHLNWVYLRGVTNAFCLSSFANSPIIQDSTICASGYNDTTQSTCQGDSGGPLTYLEEDGHHTLVGVTSFVSIQGCHADIPAGFVRPGFYHEWFQYITDENWDTEEQETTTTEAASTTTEAADTEV